ncbi:stage III sporulation protein AA [Paenibacillus sambharensis]|uniref:Stage III sporulation protein AA n=1 Tax=Paenibacillus sambharensis TaxID=1803190 RepID=A0A2W1L0I5_9BACL|nr:stage III sporulation protein AA [Paenibacillus sambharensis]PZD93428.1 stage III sporulation protein AA [Paenibacillus sambharensis]
MLNGVKHLLPAEIYQMLGKLPAEVQESLEEIRIREGRPLEIGFAGGYGFTGENGWSGINPQEAYKPSSESCRKLLERITNHSLYAMEEELRRGYITVAGGHRIGLAGRTVLEGGLVRGLRDVSGFNIRIARDISGVADRLMPRLLEPLRGSLLSALLLAPPMQGKTTMIRDIARSASYGRWGQGAGRGWPARKVGIVDERSEIAACVRGVPTFDVGPRTDVIDACPKAEGMMMLLRSMSPELLIVDEIGRVEDGDAIREAAHAGVAVIATAHAANLEEAARRPVLNRLLEEGAFELVIELRRTASGTAHHVIAVKNGKGQPGARSPTLPLDRTSAGAPLPAAAVKIGRGGSP